MHTRLKQFLSAENINQATFADSLGIGKANISHILSGRNKPGYEFIKALVQKYPLLNINWLMHGTGKMYVSNERGDEQTTRSADRTPEYVLFPDDSESSPETVSEPNIAIETNELKSDSAISHLINTLNKVQQPIVNQRKVVKITILFDDGTYQELG